MHLISLKVKRQSVRRNFNDAKISQVKAPLLVMISRAECFRILKGAFAHIEEIFDPVYGGFDGPPKFPSPSILKFLLDWRFVDSRFETLVANLHVLSAETLRELAFENDISIPRNTQSADLAAVLGERLKELLYEKMRITKKSIGMVAMTLKKMADGGICDQLGGGFHRYSVDKMFHLPHFEKQLYDQAQLAALYVETYKATKDCTFLRVATAIFEFVEGTLLDWSAGNGTNGMFFTSQDADSIPLHFGAKTRNDWSCSTHTGKKEGAFYVWTSSQLKEALGADYRIFCTMFDVHPGSSLQKEQCYLAEYLKDKCVLRRVYSVDQVAEQLHVASSAVTAAVDRSLAKLRLLRSQRPAPIVDEKRIVASNALMISAYAKAYIVTQCPRQRSIASNAAEFIFRNLYDESRNFLHRTFPRDESSLEAFSIDYVALVAAGIDLYQATFDVQWIEWADMLQQKIDGAFTDADGFVYTCRTTDPDAYIRVKDDFDASEPSATSLNVLNLIRLSKLLSSVKYFDAARIALFNNMPKMSKTPHGMTLMLAALAMYVAPPVMLSIYGEVHSASFADAFALIVRKYFNFSQYLLVVVDVSDAESFVVRCNPYFAELKERVRSAHFGEVSRENAALPACALQVTAGGWSAQCDFTEEAVEALFRKIHLEMAAD